MAEGGVASAKGVSMNTAESGWVCKGGGGRTEGFCGWGGWFFSNHRTLPKKLHAAKGHHSQGRIFQPLLLKFSKGMTGKTPQHFAPGTVPALYSMALSICEEQEGQRTPCAVVPCPREGSLPPCPNLSSTLSQPSWGQPGQGQCRGSAAEVSLGIWVGCWSGMDQQHSNGMRLLLQRTGKSWGGLKDPSEPIPVPRHRDTLF